MTSRIILLIVQFVLAVLVAFIVHEGAHYLAAKMFGKTIKFKFSWSPNKLFGFISVPRYVWLQPKLPHIKLAIVCYAGFTVEILVAILVAYFFAWFDLLIVAITHLVAYRFYAGDVSDFKFIGTDDPGFVDYDDGN